MEDLSRTESNETLAASIAYPDAPPPTRVHSLNGYENDEIKAEKEEARRSMGFKALEGMRFWTR